MEAPNIKVEDIPGYRDAVERENKIRSAAFDDDWPEFICGIEVKPLTLTHVLRLSALQSPFICGGRIPSVYDVLQFLWAVSPDYQIALKLRNWTAAIFPEFSKWIFGKIRTRFALNIGKLKYADTVAAIGVYLDDSFADGPGKPKGSGFAVAYFSGPTSIIGRMSKELHWGEERILNMPIKRLFQYSRWLRIEHDPKAILFNPSDKARREGLQKLMPE